MKGILFIDSSRYFGDEQKSMLAVIDHLDTTKFQPFVLCSDNSDSGLISKLTKNKKIVCEFIKLKSWCSDNDNYFSIITDLFQFNKVVNKLVKDYDIGVVFANNYYAGFLTTFSLPTKMPLIFNLSQKNCRKSAIYQIVKRSKKTLVISESLRNYWNKTLDYKLSDKLETLAPGFDFENASLQQSQFEFRDTYNWAKDAHIVLMFGDMLPENQHELLLQALSIAHQKDSSLFGLFIGKTFDNESSDYLNYLVQTAHEMNFLGNVAFMEFVDEYEYSVIDACHVVVSLAENNPFPSNLIKALSCGVPIVDIDNKWDKDIFKKCSSVQRVSDDPKDIANGINQCISVLGKRKDIRAEAKAFSKQYEFDRYSSRLFEVIDQV